MARIKGQEVSVNVISTLNGLETSFGDVGSLETNFDRDILDEGYLGQTTNKKDDIFKGVSGTIEFHSRTADTFGLIQRINEKTALRLPGESFQIVASYAFELGGTRRLIIPDVKFGAIPISATGRDEYVGFKLDFAADEASFIASP
jgi:hypothetical protein